MEELRRLLFEIKAKASRKRRASDLKIYLMTDLEIIEKLVIGAEKQLNKIERNELTT